MLSELHTTRGVAFRIAECRALTAVGNPLPPP